jgi:hypothetical protein
MRCVRTRDGPRYRALDNSMAVNVMRWIGWRVSMAHALARNPNDERAKDEASRRREGREGYAIVTNEPSRQKTDAASMH